MLKVVVSLGCFLTLFRMGLFGAAHGWGTPPENLSHISYNDENWHSYTLPKVDQKDFLNHVAHPLISAEISIFFTRNQQILLYQE